MRKCDEAAMAQEKAYLDTLGLVFSFAIAGGQLTLSDEAGAAVLVYNVTAQDLAGTTWQAFMFNNGKGGLAGVMNVAPTANFGADGTVSGSGGCNNYTASYTASDNQIKIGPIAATKKQCNDPAGVMQQETQFFAALESAATYQIQDQQLLEMQTAHGDSAVQFKTAAQ